MNTALAHVLNQSKEIAHHKFFDSLTQPQTEEGLVSIFGLPEGVLLEDSSLIEQLSNFSFPTIEIISETEINYALGAYSPDTDIIYISEEFLASSVNDLDGISEVILEEWGHYLDDQLNPVDTPGDEGAIFAALVKGEDLSSQQLFNLQTENDTAVVNIDGQQITIEQENEFGITNNIVYVDVDATGNNDGTSWANAYTDLQSALQTGGINREIWVAEGTYLPTTNGDRDISFEIPDRVRIYGGFAGNETSREQRDWLANPTTLSGNIGDPNNPTDNSSSVVVIDDTSAFFTVLDGFRIVEGYGDGVNIIARGGGIYASNDGNANLNNLIIANNFSNSFGAGGGGIYLSSSNFNINNVALINNTAENNGGAIYVSFSEGNITNSLFVGNSSDRSGGAIYIDGSDDGSYRLNNNTFYNNRSESGGVLYIDDFVDEESPEPAISQPILINNSIIERNRSEDGNLFASDIENPNLTINNSIVRGGYDGAGENIIDADPLFVDPNNFNFSLQSGSPAIDAGHNPAIQNIPDIDDTDFAGNPRIVNDIVDLGAYEFLTQEDVEEFNDNPASEDNAGDTLPEAEIVLGKTVYRFFNEEVGVHFYTADEAERDNISANLPQYSLEGASYTSAPESDSLTGVAPVYRFLNTATGVHLYTISEAERDSIVNNLPNYQLEGVTYYGYTEQLENTTPLYRFYNPAIDAHFYTPSTEERDIVIETLPDYQLEANGGIAFYVTPLDTPPPPIVPSLPEPTADISRNFEVANALAQLFTDVT